MMPEEQWFTKEDARIWWLLIRWLLIRIGGVVALAYGAANFEGQWQHACFVLLAGLVAFSAIQFVKAFSPGEVQHGQGGPYDDESL